MAALVCGAASARAGSPDAGDLLDLDWDAPAECPARGAVLADVARLVGPTPPPAATGQVSARAHVFRSEDGRWHVHIVTLGESGGERTLNAATCEALTAATVIVLAVRVKPSLMVEGPAGDEATSSPAPPAVPGASASAQQPMPPAPPVVEPPPAPPWPNALPVPPAPPPTPVMGTTPPPTVDASNTAQTDPRRSSLYAGAALLGTLGELPRADGSPEIEVGYTHGRLQLELHGEMTFNQEASATAGIASVHAAGGGVRGCYGPTFGRFAVFGCGDAEIDWMWASGATGQGIVSTMDRNSGWVTVGVGTGVRLSLGRRFAVRTLIEGLAPVAPPTFITLDHIGNKKGTVYEPSAVWGRAGLGLEAIFY